MSLLGMMEQFKLDPESMKGYTPEQMASVQARYAEAIQVVVDSLEAPVGLTPKEVIWTLNKARLYRYKPTRPPEARHPIPLLLSI